MPQDNYGFKSEGAKKRDKDRQDALDKLKMESVVADSKAKTRQTMGSKEDESYSSGRMNEQGKIVSDDKKPANESQGKYDTRKEAQRQGTRMYSYNGKTEYAGKTKDLNILESRGIKPSDPIALDYDIPKAKAKEAKPPSKQLASKQQYKNMQTTYSLDPFGVRRIFSKQVGVDPNRKRVYQGKAVKAGK